MSEFSKKIFAESINISEGLSFDRVQPSCSQLSVSVQQHEREGLSHATLCSILRDNSPVTPPVSQSFFL